MAWLTKIVADEQVEYRLKEHAGCAVVETGGGETVVLDDAGIPAVDYRLRPEGGASLVWMGSGLEALELVEGAALDEEGLVVLQALEGLDDAVEGGPIAGRLPGPSVDHEVLRRFRDPKKAQAAFKL